MINRRGDARGFTVFVSNTDPFLLSSSSQMLSNFFHHLITTEKKSISRVVDQAAETLVKRGRWWSCFQTRRDAQLIHTYVKIGAYGRLSFLPSSIPPTHRQIMSAFLDCFSEAETLIKSEKLSRKPIFLSSHQNHLRLHRPVPDRFPQKKGTWLLHSAGTSHSF